MTIHIAPICNSGKHSKASPCVSTAISLAYYSEHKSLKSSFSENFQCLHSISPLCSWLFLCYLLGNCIFSEVIFPECLCSGEQKWEQYALGAMKPIFFAGKVKVRKGMNMNSCSDNAFIATTFYSAAMFYSHLSH